MKPSKMDKNDIRSTIGVVSFQLDSVVAVVEGSQTETETITFEKVKEPPPIEDDKVEVLAPAALEIFPEPAEYDGDDDSQCSEHAEGGEGAGRAVAEEEEEVEEPQNDSSNHNPVTDMAPPIATNKPTTTTTTTTTATTTSATIIITTTTSTHNSATAARYSSYSKEGNNAIPTNSTPQAANATSPAAVASSHISTGRKLPFRQSQANPAASSKPNEDVKQLDRTVVTNHLTKLISGYNKGLSLKEQGISCRDFRSSFFRFLKLSETIPQEVILDENDTVVRDLSASEGENLHPVISMVKYGAKK